MAQPDTLLIDRGDLASLALLAVQPDGARLALWHGRTADANGGGQLKVVRRHAEVFGVASLIVEESLTVNADGRCAGRDALRLLQASVTAVECGCTRVLAPHHLGPEHVPVAEALERAAAVARLASPGDREALAIDLPFIDFTDEQIVELADDSGSPLRDFWPCIGGGVEPCGSCDGCTGWMSAFRAAGIPWPWAAARV